MLRDLTRTMFFKAGFNVKAEQGQDALWKIVLDLRKWVLGKAKRSGFDFPQLARLSHAALPCGVVAVGSRPPAGDTRLAGENLVTRVTVFISLLKRHGARADNGYPFCQDEKTRLPAEMLRLDS